MTSRALNILFAMVALVAFQSPSWAQQSELPQNYMMEKHGISDPFYCDLEDPIEEIACMAWDAALGRLRANYNVIDFEINLVMTASVIIQTIASSARNSLYVGHLNATTPYNSEQSPLCIIQSHGICGNHQDLLGKVLRFTDIPSRYVGIYFFDERFGRLNHAATEVFIGEKWRFVDTTWATIWFSDPMNFSTALSLDELIQSDNPSQFRFSNEMDIWFRYQYAAEIDPFSYLDEETHIALTRGGEGMVNLDFSSDNLAFSDVPNYVGTNTGENAGIALTLIDSGRDQGNMEITLGVSGVGGCSNYGSVLVDETGQEFPLTNGSNQITIRNGSTFSVKRDPNEICYIVFSDVAVVN